MPNDVVLRRVKRGHWTATQAGVIGQGKSANAALADLRAKLAESGND